MYHVIHKQTKCSKCGSQKVEAFQRQDVHDHGYRCLDCGHEKENKETMGPTTVNNVTWVKAEEIVEEF